MKTPARLAIVAGVALAAGLIVANGYEEIADAIVAAKWGLLVVIAFHLPQMVFSSLAWRSLVEGASVPGAGGCLALRLVREAVNALLPVAQVGGEFVGARLMANRGVPLAAAGAAVTIDLVLEALAQAIFTLIGLGLLLLDRQDEAVTLWLAGGALGLGALSALLLLILRSHGGRLMEALLFKAAKAFRQSWADQIVGLHAAMASICSSPSRLCAGIVLHLGSWLLGGLEVMAAMWALRHPIGLRDGLILESLGQAFHSLGFAVPGALGIQEGGLILACGLLGMDAPLAIELSLLKRVRELALGIPGLLLWRWMTRPTGLNARPAIQVPARDPKEESS